MYYLFKSYICLQSSFYRKKKPSSKISSAVHLSPALLGGQPSLAAMCGWGHCHLPSSPCLNALPPQNGYLLRMCRQDGGCSFYPLFLFFHFFCFFFKYETQIKWQDLRKWHFERTLLSAIGDDGLLVAKSEAARDERMERETNGWKRAKERKDWVCDESAPHVTAMGGGFWCECEWKRQMLQAPPLSPPPYDGHFVNLYISQISSPFFSIPPLLLPSFLTCPPVAFFPPF